MPFTDISIGDIGTIVVGIGSVVVALLVFRDGRIREKDIFLNDIIKLLDDNANRNARRRWFNTYLLRPEEQEECLRQMNALRDVKEVDIPNFIRSNIIESAYKTLSNFDLVSIFIDRYIPNKFFYKFRRDKKLDKNALLKMYILDFLSIREISLNKEYELSNQKFSMIMERYPHLNSFLKKDKYLCKKKEQCAIKDFPIRDVDCKR